MSTDAAALMLKKKIHRLPIVNQDRQVIGEFWAVANTEKKRAFIFSPWFYTILNIDNSEYVAC